MVVKSDFAFRMHESGEVDARGCQLFHDGCHVTVCVVIGAVLANRDIEKIVVSRVDVGLPVSDLTVLVGADEAVGEEIHEDAVFLTVTAKVRLPGDSFDSREAFETDGFPVIEFDGVGERFHGRGVLHGDRIGLEVNHAVAEVG